MKHYSAKPLAHLQAIQQCDAWCCANLALARFRLVPRPSLIFNVTHTLKIREGLGTRLSQIDI